MARHKKSDMNAQLGNPHRPIEKKAVSVPAVANAISIINYINKQIDGVSLSKISTNLNITKSHCYAILKTLEVNDWVRFDNDVKTYRLNSGFISSMSSILNSPTIDRIRSRARDFSRRSGFSCMLTQPQQDDTFIVIDNYPATRSTEVSYPIGYRFPHNAPGHLRAYISWQDGDFIEQALKKWQPVKYTDCSISDIDHLRREIIATRDRGYSRSIGEHFSGVAALALPIFDSSGKVSYILSVNAMIPDLIPMEGEVVLEFKKAISDIHRSIHGKLPNKFEEKLVDLVCSAHL